MKGTLKILTLTINTELLMMKKYILELVHALSL